MPSRSPSPPPPSRRGLGGDLDEPSMAGLSLRHLRPYSPGPTAASRPAPSPPPSPPPVDHPFRSPISAQPSYASEYQEQSCSEPEIELDSPPRLTILKIQRQEPSIPTSPPSFPSSPIDLEPGIPTSPPGGPPPSFDLESAMLPTFRSDTEEWHPTDGEDDLYFKSMVDNFVIAAKDVCKPSEDNVNKEALSLQRQSDGYAESALKYYNNDKSNKVKYKLIRAITSCGILDVERIYGHVNFIAKGNQQNSKEELFFAELRLDTDVPTCVLSLEGVKKVGGLWNSKYDTFHGAGLYIDAQHCYACPSGLMHPKNGLLYETGHVASSGFYHL